MWSIRKQWDEKELHHYLNIQNIANPWRDKQDHQEGNSKTKYVTPTGLEKKQKTKQTTFYLKQNSWI